VEVGDLLSSKTIIRNAGDIPLPAEGWNDVLENFRGALLFRSASTLKDKVIYKTRTHNFRVCEFLTVDEEKKTVNLYQSTSVDLKYHPFNVTTFRKFLRGLSLVGENAEAKDFKINLICIIPTFEETNSGILFAKNDENGNKQFLSVQSLCAQDPELTGRLNGYVVRASSFKNMTRFSFGGDSRLGRAIASAESVQDVRKPPDVIPKLSVQEAWSLWYGGTNPLRLIDSKSLLGTAAKTNFNRLKKVMDTMESFLVKDGRVADGQKIAELPKEDQEKLFKYAFSKLVQACYPGSTPEKKAKNAVNTFASRI